VKVEFQVPDQPVYAVRGIDLGVKRSIASVMLRPNQPLRSTDFAILRDGLKRNRLNRLDKRIAELQQARKWEPLKRIRHKRLRVSEYYDRLAARQVAATSQNSLVVVGYPKHLKYGTPIGNGKTHLRKILARWSYGRMVQYIQEECAKQGAPSEAPDERWSSRTCHRCGSRNTERLTQMARRLRENPSKKLKGDVIHVSRDQIDSDGSRSNVRLILDASVAAKRLNIAAPI